MTWLLALAWKATAVLAAAFAIHLALRRASSAARDLLWTLALCALLAIPALSIALPQWEAPAMFQFTGVASAAGKTAPAASRNWIPMLWLAGAVLCLARLALAHVRVARMARAARPSGDWRGMPVLESAETTVPVTWGFRAPAILLPPGSETWTEELRRSVLEHEAAHAARHDCLKQLLAQMACALYWFHPLAWLASRAALRAREQACDDLVLAGGAPPADYAGHLLEVARDAHRLQAAAAVTCCSELEHRLRAILDPRISRRSISRAAGLAAAAAVFVLLLPLAGLRVAQAQVEKIGGDVSAPKVLYKVEPEYTEEARDAKIEGTVVLSVEISTDGIPENIIVGRGLDPGLDANAIQAISEWRFQPGEKKGQPVRVAATIEVNYRLY